MYVCMYVCMCVYTHTHTCLAGVEIVYEVPLLPNNTVGETFLPNGERCEVLTG